MKVVLPAWRKTINETFIPLIKNTDRYLICYGGRGSSKSVFAAKKLIYRCLCEPYFRFILYRKTYNTIKDSQYQTIKDIVYDWGLQDLFTFNTSPMEIRCYNGNKFICRGGDEPKKLKSIKDPTGVWYEEEIPPEGDFITITTSIRTQKASYLQEIFTINPEVEGDYTLHWFWKRFFEGKDGDSFSDRTTIDMGEGKSFETTYTVHHSTYKDNRWIPDSFIAQLLELKKNNPYYYTIYALGKWGNRASTGQFYKLFSVAKNMIENKPVNGKPALYKPDLPLHITFDFNVNPFVTLNVWQIEGKKATQIDEICLPTPNNRTTKACQEFTRRYASHVGGLFVYGDPAGHHEDTRTEKGYNDFVAIMNELKDFKPSKRVASVAPPVVMRGNFINTIFESGYLAIEIWIGSNCAKALADYQFLKEASDGTKAKEKWKNENTGVTEEKYGHSSDANDYLICYVFSTEFTTYQRGPIKTKVTLGQNKSNNSY
jgi:phage terminase large subunit